VSENLTDEQLASNKRVIGKFDAVASLGDEVCDMLHEGDPVVYHKIEELRDAVTELRVGQHNL
jgi:hypothetical protein